jgi:predicted dehydrogenase
MYFNRRTMLKGLACAGAPLILPSSIWAQGTKANAKIRVGCVGMGTQMRGVMGGFRSQDGVEVVAVCDVDTTRRTAALESLKAAYKNGGPEVKAYTDYRELLADKSIDVVIVATPDHWHAIVTVAALKAGKDVYCEKPLTHNIKEAIAVMKAVKKYNRVLQTGSMQRSANQEFRVACELVRNNVLGKIKTIEINIGSPAVPYNLKEETMEPGLDWDKWCGPAPLVAYNPQLSPRGVHNGFPNWRNYREFATGMIGDWGAHHIDIAHWGMGMDDSGPVEILPSTNPKNTDGVSMKYANDVVLTHVNKGNGLTFAGENGSVFAGRGRFHLMMEGKDFVRFMDPNVDKDISCEGACAKATKTFLKDAKVKLEVSKNHIRNFLDCVRERKAKPITSELVGGHTAIACHLMSQAYYNKQRMCWDPQAFAFTKGTGDPAWLTRAYRGAVTLPTV